MPQIITLQCPSCGARSALGSGTDEFECPYCGNRHIFRVPTAPGRADAALTRPAAAPTASRPLIPRPKEVTIEKRGDALRLRWRWFSAKYLGLLFFAVIWDSFLCFWYSMALGIAGSGAGSPALIMLVFPLIHVAVGLGITYTTLAGLLNTTTLTLDGQRMTIQHDPVPWPGETKTPIEQLVQLYCTQKRSSSKNGVTYTYQLSALLKDGRRLDLVSNLETPDLAAFLEQQVEQHLRISDQPVTGEYGKGRE